MDLQILIVAIIVGVAAAFVLRTFTRQFTSRDRKGCGSCAHGGSGQFGMTGLSSGQTRQTRQTRLTSASREDELIQVEPIQVEESIRE
ncbi:MAG: hypothetical protein OXO51_01425 [Gemmatimonadota bacterium]|nr:hypothetical protein [Gemmatimonadota bacterium]